MKKYIFLILSVLAASVQAGPNDKPFAERFPPTSIQSMQRADEVIAAYEKEKAEWDAWREAEDKACERKFFVNDCHYDVKKHYADEVGKARAVWLAARDFQRKHNAEEAKQRREKDLKARRLHNREREAEASGRAPIPENMRGEREVREDYIDDPANDVDVRRKALPPAEPAPKDKITSSSSLAEREASRAERRREAEVKRLENIKKRAAKAAEYERQMKLREEQKNRVLDDLAPTIIYK